MVDGDDIQTPSAGAGGSKASLLVIFLTVFIDLLGFGIVLPLLPIYGKQIAGQHGFDKNQTLMIIGLLMSSFSAMQFLFLPIWGRLSDRIGRRPVLIMGLMGSTFFYAMFGVATMYRSLVGLFVTRIGAGIAGATISTAQAYIADVTTRQNRAKGMAMIGAAFALGFVLGPIIGVVSLLFTPRDTTAMPDTTASKAALDTASTTAANSSAVSSEAQAQVGLSPWPGFFASGLSGVALTIAIFKLVESWRPGVEHAKRKWFDSSALREALNTPSIGLLLLASFIAVFSFANFEATLALQIEKMTQPEKGPIESPILKSLVDKAESWGYHGDNAAVVVAFMVFSYLGVILTLAQGVLVRRLSTRLTETTMCVIGGVLAILGFIALAGAASSGDFRWFLLSMPIEVTGFAFVNPSLQSLISRRSNPARQGSIAGLSQSVTSLSRIVGPAMGPSLLILSAAAPYWIATGLMFVALALVIMASSRGADYSTAIP